jgi:hypothetical protein
MPQAAMNQNEQSAEALRLWLKEQQEMQNKAVQQRTRLLTLKNATANVGSERSWIDDALENVQGSIDHFSKSMQFTQSLISLAEANQLHNPARG